MYLFLGVISLANRIYRFSLGFILFLLCKRTINLAKLCEGKRIAILGAADSAFNTGKGSYIDGFDIVIRINKAPLLLKNETWKNDIGTKTDILFHSFFENERSGGGPLDIALFDALKIQYLVNPISEYRGYRVIFNFYKKYLLPKTVYSIPRNIYKKIKEQLGNYQPTIGFCALYAVLQTNFSELYITGFTFFKTDFGKGYRDEIKESKLAKQFIYDAGLHNPDLEYREFAKLYKQHSTKKIVTDEVLYTILRSNSF